jgi:hypothetical protein
MSKNLLLIALCVSLLWADLPTATADNTATLDPRVEQLAEKILIKVPEIKSTIPFLGSKEQRIVMARKHATAILAASDKYADQWQGFAKQAGWQYFDAHRDLPALIAALTYRESAFRSVIRNDDNSTTTIVPARRMGEKKAYDSGVMQIRVPSANGRECGLQGRAGISRILTDLTFAYDVGTCVFTNHIKEFVATYADVKVTRLKHGQRPDSELKFYGVMGDRKDSLEAQRARELLVIERYNWGDSGLYQHKTGAGYARRIISAYEFFRPG